MAANFSYASPTADAVVAPLVFTGSLSALIGQILTGVKIWHIFITLILGLVAYDQSELRPGTTLPQLLTI